MTTQPKPYKRSIRNFILNPKVQFRITIYFVALGFAISALMTFIFFMQVQQVEILVGSIPGAPIDQQIEISLLLNSLVKITILFFFVFMVVTGMYGIIISHRIAGPMYAILAYIQEMKKGNYDSGRKLRDSDELMPIMDSLHDLSKHLKNKK